MLCGMRDAEQRVAQHSAAQHSTCKRHMHDASVRCVLSMLWSRVLMQLLLLGAGGVGRAVVFSSLSWAAFVFGESVVSDLFLLVGLVPDRGGRRDGSCRPSVPRVVARALCGGVRRPFWLGASVVDGSGLGFSLVVMEFFIVSLFGLFLRHLRVAGCPLGGEICGVALATRSFHLGGHSRSFCCSSQLQIWKAAEVRGLHRLR